MYKRDLNKNTVCVILGGGAGTRLYPLTKDRSKPAVPVAGKYRLIDIPISNCLNSGLQRIFVLTQFNSASLNKHVSNTFHFDQFSDAFVDILAAEQTRSSTDWFQGTADAVRKIAIHLRNLEFDNLLILSGDHLYQMNFLDFIERHIETSADITIGTIPVHANDASAFGIMKVGENNIIESFIEKPSPEVLPEWKSEVEPALAEKGQEYLASMGIYVFKREALRKLIYGYGEATDFGKELIPSAINDKMNVVSFAFQGYWTDIGDIRSYFDANIALTYPLPEFDLFDKNNALHTRARILPPSKINKCKINYAVIAEGAIVEAAEVEHSIVGIRSVIKANTVIKRSYIIGNDYYQSPEDIEVLKMHEFMIGENCYIENAIVDKHVHIGNNVSIVGSDELEDFEGPNYHIRKGIVVVHKQANIPDGTVIGKK